MLTSVLFSGFRGFQRFEASLAPTTAFLGPNSCGKTTVLHAIRLACDALRLALEANTQSRLDADGVTVAENLEIDHGRLLPLADWQAMFVNQSVGDGVSVGIRLTFRDVDPVQQLDVSLAPARAGLVALAVRVKSGGAARAVAGYADDPVELASRLSLYLKDRAPIAVFVPPFYGAVRFEEFRAPAVVDGLIGSGDQSHVVRNLVVGLEFLSFDRLNSFLGEVADSAITLRSSPDEAQWRRYLAVLFRDHDGPIELSGAGAGLIHLVALFSALARWRMEGSRRSVVFMLDEPEAHLHPRLSADATERLAAIVTREYQAQVLLATHSIDILNRLFSAGARLIRCDRRSELSAVDLDSDTKLFDDIAGWADLTPFTAINFLASRRIVFCEGEDDVGLLQRLGELRFRNAPGRAVAFRRWAFVRLHGSSNQPMAGLIARLVQSDAVKARARDGGFRVEVVLDRDYDRKPGSETVEQDGIQETTTVWSQHSIESLLVESRVLTKWVRAYARMAERTGIEDLVEDAVASANADDALLDDAIAQLERKLFFGEMRGNDGIVLSGERKLVEAQRLARKWVGEEPQVWQRGKDRARFILRRIRDGLSPSVRNRFPTDVVRLIERTDTNQIGIALEAIPAEIGEFLDRLAGV